MPAAMKAAIEKTTDPIRRMLTIVATRGEAVREIPVVFITSLSNTEPLRGRPREFTFLHYCKACLPIFAQQGSDCDNSFP